VPKVSLCPCHYPSLSILSPFSLSLSLSLSLSPLFLFLDGFSLSPLFLFLDGFSLSQLLLVFEWGQGVGDKEREKGPHG
jgi:hypothetical protein